MGDSGLDWEWTRTEFRKVLLACTNAANDGDLSEGVGLFWELRGSSLLMLNFRHRPSLKQQRDLSELAAACEFLNRCEFRDDPEWDEGVTRDYLEDAIKYAQRSRPLFEGI
jgi:hypothetical protein